MGVPKFFRWISERYPRINQRVGSLPNSETTERYFGQPPPTPGETPDPLSQCGLAPEIDRLYLDMNGIIHGCSHNNSGDEDESRSSTDDASKGRTNKKVVSQEEIFRNVCYYLDRIVGDIAQPNQLVYMAIDGVAPRAKMNQQRSRRYRSGLEGQIETTIYEAHAQKIRREEEQRLAEERGWSSDIGEEDRYNRYDGGRDQASMATPFSMDDGFSFVYDGDREDTKRRSEKVNNNSDDSLEEVSPGRFKGKFETSKTPSPNLSKHAKNGVSMQRNDGDSDINDPFHSNVITPGTPFFQEFTRHLEHFVKYKISTDPKWQKLTIIFSGPNVPGEGEHKIMDFIRAEKAKPDYNPNLRHCIMGQDGDLIMLGLATHEPNLVLLRERVIFNMGKRQLASNQYENDLDAYIHNSHFEFLHMGVLRDYLAYEFETSNVLPTSKFDLEHTVDDFIFMTFFVGNDFLPHMPALDIADHAFDLLFRTYKQCREKWMEEDPERPYLTNAGSIISGRRLEDFLSTVGSHEVTYYDKKKQAAPNEEKRIKRVYKKFGMNNSLPDAKLVANKEESDRAAYREMLVQEHTQLFESAEESEEEIEDTSFSPVMTSDFQPMEDNTNEEQGFLSKLGSLLQNSLSMTDENGSSVDKLHNLGMDDTDLKGRYYYDKFQFTPFDEEKHLALRKAYVEGLVWNLKYYFEGCPSWEWYFPYHYGPMLSDLVNLDEVLDEISFEGREGKPLKPFEQLMACMPPSQAKHLPVPYQKFMTEPNSPIIDFYPESFTIDMNGKRWPWEAVTLLPFIDSKRILEVSATIDESQLTEEEISRNSFGEAVVFTHDPNFSSQLEVIAEIEGLNGLDECSAKGVTFPDSTLHFTPPRKAVLEPKLLPGVQIPLASFGSLRAAPVHSLWRRIIGVDVFQSRSRYKTACLEMTNVMPEDEPLEIEEIASKLIGTTIYMNYPYFLEAFVTAVSNESMTIRGTDEPKQWNEAEVLAWKNRRDGLARQFLIGEGFTGTGGISIPYEQAITLSVRPFEKLTESKKNKNLVKSYAKFEVEVPLIANFWKPSQLDSRLALASNLEINRFEIALENEHSIQSAMGKKNAEPLKRLFPPRKASSTKIQSASFSSRSHNGAERNSRKFSTSPSYSPTIDENVKSSLASTLRRLEKRQMDTLRAVDPCSRSKIAPRWHFARGSSRGRLLAAGALAAGFFFTGVQGVKTLDLSPSASGHLLQAESNLIDSFSPYKIRGGDFEEDTQHNAAPPPLEFFHGTTTLSFIFDGGIIAAVDSRASLGTFVGSKTTQKVLPVSSHILGTMAGGAADCMHWIRKLKSQAMLHELTEGTRMSVPRASRILSNALYEYRGQDLSVGTMIMGFDGDESKATGTPRIFYVDNSGKRIEGNMFAVGSGSTFALGILDTEFRKDLTVDEAIALGIKAIRHATFRDAYSGGTINVFHITQDGWTKVYTGDISRGSFSNIA